MTQLTSNTPMACVVADYTSSVDEPERTHRIT